MPLIDFPGKQCNTCNRYFTPDQNTSDTCSKKFAHKKLGIAIPNPACEAIDLSERDTFIEANYRSAPPELMKDSEIVSDNTMYSQHRSESKLRDRYESVLNQIEELNKKPKKSLKEAAQLRELELKRDDLAEDKDLKNQLAADDKLKAALATNTGPMPALQWLFNQSRCFKPHTMSADPFQVDQIRIIRQYNLWRNGGTMISDAHSDFQGQPWNAGEEPDPFSILDEGSGQAYPEVDHTLPKKSGGLNSYANARLISFSLNHIYRTKPAEPPDAAKFGAHIEKANGKAIYDSFVKLYGDGALRGNTKVTANSPGYNYATKIKARRTYLQDSDARVKRVQEQKARAKDFEAVRARLREGYLNFVAHPPSELIELMRKFQFELLLNFRGSRQFGLDDLSDEVTVPQAMPTEEVTMKDVSTESK